MINRCIFHFYYLMYHDYLDKVSRLCKDNYSFLTIYTKEDYFIYIKFIWI